MPDKQSAFVGHDAKAAFRREVMEILRLRANPSKFIEYFHEDATFHMIGRTVDYSFGGVFRGKARIFALLQKIDAEVDLTNHKILNFLIEDDTFAIRRTIVVRHHGTAAARPLTLANLVRFKQGRIQEVFEYVDTSWLKQLSGEDHAMD